MKMPIQRFAEDLILVCDDTTCDNAVDVRVETTAVDGNTWSGKITWPDGWTMALDGACYCPQHSSE